MKPAAPKPRVMRTAHHDSQDATDMQDCTCSLAGVPGPRHPKVTGWTSFAEMDPIPSMLDAVRPGCTPRQALWMLTNRPTLRTKYSW